MFSSYSVHRSFRTLLNNRDEEDDAIDEYGNIDILGSQMAKYIGYLLYHMNSISTKANRQVFFHSTFICKYYGVSRRGIHALSMLGYVCKLSYFDEQMKNILNQAKINIRYLHYTSCHNTVCVYSCAIWCIYKHDSILHVCIMTTGVDELLIRYVCIVILAVVW